MSREIKFRAWDKANTVMILDPLAWDNVREDITSSDGYIINTGDAKSRYMVMQYTGLKDANGVEIYEGDIVRWRSRHNPKMECRHDEVIFSGGFWCLCPFIFELSEAEKSSLTVVGNVYKNPELMKESA